MNREEVLKFIEGLSERLQKNLFIWHEGRPYSLSVVYYEIKAKTKMSKVMLKEFKQEVRK